MAVVLESFALSTFNNFNSGQDITPTLPAGTVAGDLLLFYLRQENNVVAQPDWSVEPLTVLHESQGTINYMQGAVYFVIHDGASTYTWRSNTTSTADIAAVVLRISGHDAANPIDASAGPTECQTCDPASSPAITTIKDNVPIFIFSGSTSQPNIASGVPAGFTSIGAIGGNPVFSAVQAASRDTLASPPGSIGPFAWGLVGSNRSHDSYTVGVRPASGGGGGNMGSPGTAKKQVTKADVLAAREHAKATGAKVKTKFDQRRR